MEALATFIFWAALFFLMMRIGCGAHIMGHRGKRRPTASGNESKAGNRGDLRWVPPETDTDPVCGKQVRTREARPSVYDGLVYYFCSRECREAFEVAPESYLMPARENAEARHG